MRFFRTHRRILNIVTFLPLGDGCGVDAVLLGEARTSLKKVDAILVDAQAISSSAKEATSDLSALRGDVEASLRKVEGLVNEINRKWPFARDAEMKLP